MTDRPHFVNSSDNPTASADLVALGSQLRELRISRAITLEVLSERTGFSKGYLSRIENGRKTPPLGSLARIAVALGTTVSKMLNQQPSEVSSDSSPFFSIVRKADRARVVTGASAFGYDYVSLSRAAHGSPQLQPLIFTFPKEVDKFVFFERWRRVTASISIPACRIAGGLWTMRPLRWSLPVRPIPVCGPTGTTSVRPPIIARVQ